MDDAEIGSAAKTLMYQQAEFMWYGIFDIQANFYAIPEDDKKAKSKYLETWPALPEYWRWKKVAEPYYKTQLMERRSTYRRGEGSLTVPTPAVPAATEIPPKQ
jgi:hypothetical protein